MDRTFRPIQTILIGVAISLICLPYADTSVVAFAKPETSASNKDVIIELDLGDHQGQLNYESTGGSGYLRGYYDDLSFNLRKYLNKTVYGSFYSNRHFGRFSSKLRDDNFYLSARLYDRLDRERDDIYIRKTGSNIYGSLRNNAEEVAKVDIRPDEGYFSQEGNTLSYLRQKTPYGQTIELDLEGSQEDGNFVYTDRSETVADFNGNFDEFGLTGYRYHSQDNDGTTARLYNDKYSVLLQGFYWDGQIYGCGFISDSQNNKLINNFYLHEADGDIQAYLEEGDDQQRVLDIDLQNSADDFNLRMDYSRQDDFLNVEHNGDDNTTAVDGSIGTVDLAFEKDADGYYSGHISESGVDYVQLLPTQDLGDIEFNSGDNVEAIFSDGYRQGSLTEGDNSLSYDWGKGFNSLDCFWGDFTASVRNNDNSLDIDIDYTDFNFDLWLIYEPLSFSSVLLYEDWNANVDWDEGARIDIRNGSGRLLVNTGVPIGDSLAFNTFLLNYKDMQVDFSGSRAKWGGSLMGLYSNRGRYLLKVRTRRGENIISSLQGEFRKRKDGISFLDLPDIATSLRQDYEKFLESRLYINLREVKKHISLGDRKLDEMLYRVARDNRRISLTVGQAVNLMASGGSIDDIYSAVETWFEEPVHRIFERRQKRLIYSLANSLAGAETGISGGRFNLNSSLYSETSFRDGVLYNVNSSMPINGEVFNVYQGAGVLDVKVPLFSNRGETMLGATATTDVFSAHSIRNIFESDIASIGIEQLYYVYSFDDDVVLSVGDRDGSKWSDLGFKEDSFKILLKNDERCFLPGAMAGAILKHPENKYFFRTRVIPYLPLAQDDENNLMLKWNDPDEEASLLDSVAFAYDTVCGINQKFFGRDVLLSLHRDVNNNSSFLQKVEILPSVALGSETQFTDKRQLEDVSYFMDLEFGSLQSHLYLEEGLERAVLTKGADIGYDFGKYNLQLFWEQTEWENDGDIEKVEDNIGLSFSKGNNLKAILSLSANYALEMNSYFGGFQYMLNSQESAYLSAGMQYLNYYDDKDEVDIKAQANFRF